ncbi:MAG: hypothetical protein DHS20C06_06300 [Hyphobacterium sp.]|nr:MAG: hypothetical protein DHS20C06_06300 [Hyphobacterium sp.]
MAALVIKFLIFGAGLINFAPIFGLISRRQLERMYQSPIGGADLSIMMRHRAALFGIIGGFMLYAAFYEDLHFAAILMGFAAMLSYIALAVLTGGYNAALRTVIRIDAVGIGFLVLASLLKLL